MIKLKKLENLLFAVMTLSIFSLSNETFAETVLDTSIGLEQEYNDNILFTREDEIDDFITHIIPALRLKNNTERFTFLALARLDSFLYWDNNDLNTTNQYYAANGKYRVTERWSISGNADYRKDTTLDSQLEETGIVGIRQKRERFDAGAGTSYNISERSSLGFKYDYQKTNYANDFDVDNQLNSFRLLYNRRLINEVDTLTIFPEFTYGTSDEWDAYNSSLNFGVEHQFNPTLKGAFLIGVRNTQVNYKYERDDSNDWGGVVDAWIEKSGEVTVGRLALTNRLETQTNGNIVNVARLLGNVDRALTERFGVGFRGGLYYTRPIQEIEPKDGDTWYFLLSPSLFYRLTEDYSLRLIYSYDQEIQPDLDNSRRDRQRIWLRLDFNFPDTWNRLFS